MTDDQRPVEAADEPAKKAWHKPVHSELEFDRTALTAAAQPCDSGCCCCSYTPS